MYFRFKKLNIFQLNENLTPYICQPITNSVSPATYLIIIIGLTTQCFITLHIQSVENEEIKKIFSISLEILIVFVIGLCPALVIVKGYMSYFSDLWCLSTTKSSLSENKKQTDFKIQVRNKFLLLWLPRTRITTTVTRRPLVLLNSSCWLLAWYLVTYFCYAILICKQTNSLSKRCTVCVWRCQVYKRSLVQINIHC